MDRPLPKSLVAKSVGITPAQLARLEANQRGLYVEHFASLAAALVPNLEKIVLRRQDVTAAKQLPEQKQPANPRKRRR